MDILSRAKADIEKITTGGDGVQMTLIAPGGEQASVTGFHTRHNMRFDPETGVFRNSLNAHVSFSERFLTEASYPVRNNSGDVALSNHKVLVNDGTGTEKKYTIKEFWPDDKLGFIVCILSSCE